MKLLLLIIIIFLLFLKPCFSEEVYPLDGACIPTITFSASADSTSIIYYTGTISDLIPQGFDLSFAVNTDCPNVSLRLGTSGNDYIAFVNFNNVNSSNYTSILDSDNDGIGDLFDLNPYSSDPYTAGFSSFVYDTNTGEVVAGEIVDSNGQFYIFGELPSDLNGYSLETLDSPTMISDTEMAEDLSFISDNPNIHSSGGGNLDVGEDGTLDVTSIHSLPISDSFDNNITHPTPSIGSDPNAAPSQTPTGNETDNEALRKTAANTDATNKNVQRTNDYLKINNDLLSQISSKISHLDLSSNSSGTTEVNIEGVPTAEEIGQSVKDKLEEVGESYDNTSTDNISNHNISQETKDSYGLKFSTRTDAFINTIKNSDLFTFGSDLFSIPDFSGSNSQKTIEIGKWGGSVDESTTVDMADYDQIWLLLSGILLILTSYKCFKIVVVKHG